MKKNIILLAKGHRGETIEHDTDLSASTFNGWPCVLNKGEPLPGDDFVEELNLLHGENEELKAKIGLAHELFSKFMSTPYDISGHDSAKEVAAWMQSESILILDKLEA